MSKRISELLPVTLPLAGNELLEIVQTGKSLRIRAADLVMRGADGKSAFDVAVEQGFVGTVDEWLASLQGVEGAVGPMGPRGPQGIQGPIGPEGPQGLLGDEGKSAYDLAVEQGYVGTLTDWLESLKGDGTGPAGKSAYQLAVENGFVGTVNEWLASLVGPQGPKGDQGLVGPQGDQGLAGPAGPIGPEGKSAYEVAVANGFVGTEQEWLDSLQGTSGTGDGTAGADGESAYEIAVRNGFVGTETEWLASLEGADGAAGPAGPAGADGASAYEVAVANGFVGTESEWLASLQGDSTGGSTGGSVPASVVVEVNGWTANNFVAPSGVVIAKEYNDTSIKITHNKGMYPTGWFAFNKEGSPMVGLPPTGTRNIQILDTNTVIITGVSSLEQFNVVLNFA